MGDLDRDTSLEPLGSTRYRATISRDWWVDRGANGGLIAAIALRAARAAAAAADRPPCSLTVHFLAAAQEGPLDVSVDVARAGSRLTNCLVTMGQNGTPTALALVALSTRRTSEQQFDDTVPPPAPPPDTIEPLPVTAPGVPAFLANYDLRFAVGHLPFTGAPEATSGAWVRMASPRRPDALAIAAIADGWAPTPFVRRSAPAAAPTIDMTVHFRDHDWYARAAEDDFVLARFSSRLLAGGLFEEDGEIWSPDGVLLAHSRQLGLLVDSPGAS
jgi:acyl-CoA thioesterase